MKRICSYPDDKNKEVLSLSTGGVPETNILQLVSCSGEINKVYVTVKVRCNP